MSLKLKSNKNLSPIRNQIIDLTKENTSVIEFACGDGQLMLKLSHKINYGIGIDKSKSKIFEALRAKKEMQISNIDFQCNTLEKGFVSPHFYDTGIANLFFHVIPVSDALYLLNQMKKISKTALIGGFSKPKNLYQKTLLLADQKLTDHYKYFRQYQKMGYLKGILAKANISNYNEFDTEIPFLKIYKINNLGGKSSKQ